MDTGNGGACIVFNIKGNTYRVVVAIKYDFFAVYISSESADNS